MTKCTECGLETMENFPYKPREYLEIDGEMRLVVKHKCRNCGYLKSEVTTK